MEKSRYDGYITLLRTLLCEKKLRHSLSVMETAERLAPFFGCDADKAALAGLLHDITKDQTPEEQLQLCGEFGIMLDKVSAGEEKLLHAVTGEGFLRCRLGIADREVLDAVRYHTTGRAAMTSLDKVLYLADYIEPLRRFEGVEAVRALASEGSLDEALFLALSQTIGELLGRGSAIHRDTVDARNSLIEAGLLSGRASSGQRQRRNNII